MELFTHNIGSGESVHIDKIMNVLQFSTTGISGGTPAYTISGNLKLPINGIATPSTAVNVINSFNSMIASPSAPWDGVVITAGAGTTVSITMQIDVR